MLLALFVRTRGEITFLDFLVFFSFFRLETVVLLTGVVPDLLRRLAAFCLRLYFRDLGGIIKASSKRLESTAKIGLPLRNSIILPKNPVLVVPFAIFTLLYQVQQPARSK